MKLFRHALVACATLFIAIPAQAQVTESATADKPPSASSANPSPESAGPAATSAKEPTSAANANYDLAMDAFAEGDFIRAAQLFDQVARESDNPSRRAAAADLAEQSRKRADKANQRLPAGPGATPATHIAAQKPAAELAEEEQGSTRFRLLYATSALGLAFYGPTLAYLVDADDSQAAGIYMLTAGASFLVPLLATQNQRVTLGMSTLAAALGTMGIGHGALLYGLLRGDNDASSKPLLATMLVASVGEGLAGYLWAQHTNTSGGTAMAMAGGGAFGAGWALLGNLFILGEDIDELNERVLAGTVLAGSIGGIVAGKRLADVRTYTLGDASVVQLGGLLGVYGAAVPLVLFEADDPRAIAGTMLASSLLGLYVGDRLVADKDFTATESGLVGLGSISGALLGLGATLVLDSDNEKVLVTMTAAGAIAGYGLTSHHLDVRPDGSTKSTQRITLQLAPYGAPGGARGLSVAGAF